MCRQYIVQLILFLTPLVACAQSVPIQPAAGDHAGMDAMKNPMALLEPTCRVEDFVVAGVRLGDPAKNIPAPEKPREMTDEEMWNTPLAITGARSQTKDKVAKMTSGLVITDDEVWYHVKDGRVIQIDLAEKNRAVEALLNVSIKILMEKLGEPERVEHDVINVEHQGQRSSVPIINYYFKGGTFEFSYVSKSISWISLRTTDEVLDQNPTKPNSTVVEKSAQPKTDISFTIRYDDGWTRHFELKDGLVIHQWFAKRDGRRVDAVIDRIRMRPDSGGRYRITYPQGNAYEIWKVVPGIIESERWVDGRLESRGRSLPASDEASSTTPPSER